MKPGPLALLLASLTLVVGLAVSSLAGPSTARIRELDVAVAGQELLLSFTLADFLDEELEERLDSGLPTRLVYEIELMLERRSWWDKTKARGRLQMIAMFNALTREYLLNIKLDGELIESRVLRDSDQLWLAMTQVEKLPIFELDEPPGQEKLQLRVRAELGTTTTLLFIPRTVHTEWATTPSFEWAQLPKVE